jgi:hypothetical protein
MERGHGHGKFDISISTGAISGKTFFIVWNYLDQHMIRKEVFDHMVLNDLLSEKSKKRLADVIAQGLYAMPVR